MTVLLCSLIASRDSEVFVILCNSNKEKMSEESLALNGKLSGKNYQFDALEVHVVEMD